MELDFIVNPNLLSPKQRPAWYRGEKLIKSLDTESCGEIHLVVMSVMGLSTRYSPILKLNGLLRIELLPFWVEIAMH